QPRRHGVAGVVVVHGDRDRERAALLRDLHVETERAFAEVLREPEQTVMRHALADRRTGRDRGALLRHVTVLALVAALGLGSGLPVGVLGEHRDALRLPPVAAAAQRSLGVLLRAAHAMEVVIVEIA